MLEFHGVRVQLKGEGARNFLPGGEHPGVVRYYALETASGGLHVQAVCSQAEGYTAIAFGPHAWMWWEPLL